MQNSVYVGIRTAELGNILGNLILGNLMINLIE